MTQELRPVTDSTHRTMVVVDNGKNWVECRCDWMKVQAGGDAPVYEPKTIDDLIGVGELHAEISNEQEELDLMERHDRLVFGRSE